MIKIVTCGLGRGSVSGVRMADCSRKRLRFCEHCGKEVTYPVYKKHKEEIFDYHKKEWKVKHKSYPEEVDAEDDAIIRDVVTSSTAGINSVATRLV